MSTELPLTLDRHPDGATIRLQRRYAHPVERVWRALTDPEELAHWFPQNEPLHVLERDEPRLLRGTWYGDELRFELEPVGGGCVLRFSHSFANSEKAARDAAGWDACFERFDALLDGRPVDEAGSLQTWSAKHESYAERFGVDPELGRRTFAEYQAGEL